MRQADCGRPERVPLVPPLQYGLCMQLLWPLPRACLIVIFFFQQAFTSTFKEGQKVILICAIGFFYY